MEESLLTQDASQELLELELQATPASMRPAGAEGSTPIPFTGTARPAAARSAAVAEHVLEEYEHQMALLHQQVDQLRAQLLGQAEQEEALQVRRTAFFGYPCIACTDLSSKLFLQAAVLATILVDSTFQLMMTPSPAG